MSTFEPTREPFEETTRHITRGGLPESVFAFPKQYTPEKLEHPIREWDDFGA